LRLLFLVPRFPYPFHKGDQLTVYRRLLAVHEKHEVTLLSFSDSMNPDGMEHIQSLCRGGVHLVRHGAYDPFFYGALKGLVSSLPLQVLLFQSREFAQCLTELLRQEQFDIVHFFASHGAVSKACQEYTLCHRSGRLHEPEHRAAHPV